MSVNSPLSERSDAESVRSLLGLSVDEPEDGTELVHGLTLTSPDAARRLIDRVGALLGTDKPAVAASQFTKWYCRALTAVLYEFSAEGAARAASLRDIAIAFPGGDAPIAVHCGGKTFPVDNDAAREPMRELTMIRLFAQNWNLVFKTLSAVSGVREDALWENGSMYVHYYYRQWIEEADSPGRRAALEDDYEYIVGRAAPELYGELQCFNPFLGTGKPVRSTCCLRYMLPDGNACKGCPVKFARK